MQRSERSRQGAVIAVSRTTPKLGQMQGVRIYRDWADDHADCKPAFRHYDRTPLTTEAALRLAWAGSF